MIKKHFNKNLAMSIEDKRSFKLNNKCWICNKLFAAGDVKLSVIPNGLEKYMVFRINKNLVFIDNMQFMNSSLDALVTNLSDNDFKHL